MRSPLFPQKTYIFVTCLYLAPYKYIYLYSGILLEHTCTRIVLLNKNLESEVWNCAV